MSIVLLAILVGYSSDASMFSGETKDFGYTNPVSNEVPYEHRNPNLGIYLAESGASFAFGNAAGVGVVILLSLGYETPSGTHQPPVSILAYPFVFPFASALGVHLVGHRFKCPGSYWGAVGGGFLGMAAGLTSLYLLGYENTETFAWVLAVALPPILSTVGYNTFGRKTYNQSGSPIDVNYCTMILHSLESNEVATCHKISINIVGITF